MRLNRVAMFHQAFHPAQGGGSVKQIQSTSHAQGLHSGAARDLNVSQPSVSKVLRHAEDQLGIELFAKSLMFMKVCLVAQMVAIALNILKPRLTTPSRDLSH